MIVRTRTKNEVEQDPQSMGWLIFPEEETMLHSEVKPLGSSSWFLLLATLRELHREARSEESWRSVELCYHLPFRLRGEPSQSWRHARVFLETPWQPAVISWKREPSSISLFVKLVAAVSSSPHQARPSRVPLSPFPSKTMSLGSQDRNIIHRCLTIPEILSTIFFSVSTSYSSTILDTSDH